MLEPQIQTRCEKLATSTQLPVAALLLCVWLAGCKDAHTPAPNHATVSGRLFVDGKPAEGAIIKFLPTSSADHPISASFTAGAIVSADGLFVTSHQMNSAGLPPGQYVMLVIWMQEPPEGGLAMDRLQGRYSDEKNPLKTFVMGNSDLDLGAIELDL
jgi:hypothetical protein